MVGSKQSKSNIPPHACRRRIVVRLRYDEKDDGVIIHIMWWAAKNKNSTTNIIIL